MIDYLLKDIISTLIDSNVLGWLDKKTVCKGWKNVRNCWMNSIEFFLREVNKELK